MIVNLTNATKAQLTLFVNQIFAGIVLFGLLSDAKAGALALIVNTGIGLYIALTYKNSPKRLPEGLEVDPGPPPYLEKED